MRILLTTFTFAPQANGVAEVVREQACGLAARGHEVTVATLREPRRTSADTFGRLQIREFQIGGLYASRGGYTGEVAAYQNFIEREPVDVMLFHGWQVWPTDLALAVAPRGAIKVLVSHGFDAQRWKRYPRFPWGLALWARSFRYVLRTPRLLRRLDHVVFLSPRVDRERFFDHWLLQRFGGPDWSAIPNGCRPEQFPAASPGFRQKHSLGERFVVLCVGAYATNKNQAAALRAFCAADLEAAVLVFIGHELNDYARDLQTLAKTLMPPHAPTRVLFLERQGRDAIREAYQAADLVMVTSEGETQPLVLLDAMACGKPFLSTDVGCVSELPGAVVVRHESQLPDALRSLHADPASRATLAAAGQSAARTEYHWENILDRYDQLLRRLVTKPTGKIS